MVQNQYDVSAYSDEELYNILELNPTASDRELEARIIQMIQRHMYLTTVTGRKLFKFFKDIYEHFFDIERIDDAKPDASYTRDELEDNDYSPTKIDAEKKQEQELRSREPPTFSETKRFGNEMDSAAEKPDNLAENQVYTKELDYTIGKVNPILKETYRRIITIDSQYRDEEYILSTDFTINFSEVLKDIVSLKLYAVQLPVTWYTISESYGSNSFFFKPIINEEDDLLNNTLAISYSNHEYKVEIDPGNYTSGSLVEEVNSKINELSSIYTDVSFGNTKIEYNVPQAKSSITVDIQKVYKEFSYNVSFSSELKELLFPNDNVYSPSEIVITRDATDISWSSTQSFFLRQYMPTESQNTFQKEEDGSVLPEINHIELPLGTDTTARNVEGWVIYINQLMQENTIWTSNLEPESILAYNTSTKQYIWDLIPKRHRVLFQNGSQWILERPDDSNFGNFKYNETRKEIRKDIFTDTLGLSNISFSTPQQIRFQPRIITNSGVYIDPIQHPTKTQYNDIIIEVPSNTYYSDFDSLVNDINLRFQNAPLLQNTQINKEVIGENTNYYIHYNINKVYTSKHYKIVFYDIYSFSRCLNPFSGYRNAKVDTTLGYILGFKALAEYDLIESNQLTVVDKIFFRNPDTESSTNSVYSYVDVYDRENIIRTPVTLKGNAVVSIYLYNYFMIILDDFKQNHLNDGLVTLISKDKSVSLPSYATRKNARICDPTTNEETNTLSNTAGLTQKQIYSVEQILETQNRTKSLYNDNVSVKDMFALLPVKSSGSTPGSIYVEFGGTLQQQERTYFGPVNIGRIAVKLMNDKGDVVDLNGGNWSFQLVCEQLYQNTVREPS